MPTPQILLLILAATSPAHRVPCLMNMIFENIHRKKIEVTHLFSFVGS